MWSPLLLIAAAFGSVTPEAAQSEPVSLVNFDLGEALAAMPQDTVLQYDTLKLVSALQGLVNRERPRMLIRFLQGEGCKRTDKS